MLSISQNGIISMSKGDSWKTSIFINIGTALEPAPYNLDEGDHVYFGVMEPNQPFKDALVCKKLGAADRTPKDGDDGDADGDGFRDGYVDLYFDSKDTEHLIPGVYYYEVKLLRPATDPGALEHGITESVDTIIPRTKFIIME